MIIVRENQIRIGAAAFSPFPQTKGLRKKITLIPI